MHSEPGGLFKNVNFSLLECDCKLGHVKYLEKKVKIVPAHPQYNLWPGLNKEDSDLDVFSLMK